MSAWRIFLSTKYIISIFMSTLFFSSTSFAADVILQINGRVLGQSCNVKSSDLTKNVQFDDLDPKSFPSIGSVSQDQMVTIGLENCTGELPDVTYQFSGEADDTNANLLKVTGGGSSTGNLASGLAIEILDSNKASIPLNQLQKLSQTISTATYDFNFYLRYKSVKPNITAGDASSILYFDIYYE